MIVTIIGMILCHLYSDFWCMYIAYNILGNRYSKKTTILITFLCSVLRCAWKIYLFMNDGLGMVVVTSIVAYLSYFIYVILLFRSSVGKRIMVMSSCSIMMSLMDMLASNVMVAITGTFTLMQMDNELQTVIYMIVTEIFITVGLFALYMGLKWMNTIKWESGLYQWLSLFFPISQFTIGIYTAGKWLANRMLMPTMSIVGLCVGLVADIYMIMIFLRSNSRRIAEKNLEQINQKYELEQMRYEQLKENQEEVSKIRHDFQNYILTVKNMK